MDYAPSGLEYMCFEFWMGFTHPYEISPFQGLDFGKVSSNSFGDSVLSSLR
jgi:hypothetical protein